MEVVNKLIDTDEALVNQIDSDAKHYAGISGATTDPSSKLAMEGRRPSMFNIEEFNSVLDSPCMFHKGATHTICECSQFKRTFHTPEDLK
jgi:hypothetical protein